MDNYTRDLSFSPIRRVRPRLLPPNEQVNVLPTLELDPIQLAETQRELDAVNRRWRSNRLGRAYLRSLRPGWGVEG